MSKTTKPTLEKAQSDSADMEAKPATKPAKPRQTIEEMEAALEQPLPGSPPEPESPTYPPTPTLNPDDPDEFESIAPKIRTNIEQISEVQLADSPPIPGTHTVAPPTPPVVPPGLATAAPAAPAPGKRWFKKVNVALPFFVGGKAVKFDALGGNIGVAVFDEAQNAALIAALDAACEARKGGVVAIDEDTFNDLKKNLPWTPLRRGSQPALRVWDSKPPRALSASAQRGSAAGNGVAMAKPPSGVGGSRGSATPVAGDTASAGKPPAVFAPALQKKSEGKVPVLKAPSTGVFRPEVPRV